LVQRVQVLLLQLLLYLLRMGVNVQQQVARELAVAGLQAHVFRVFFNMVS
jgi:hypothetical protein